MFHPATSLPWAPGPRFPTLRPFRMPLLVVKEYGLLPSFPKAIRAWFEHPERIPETPKNGDPAFDRSHFHLILDSSDLLASAAQAAGGRGIVTRCDTSTDDTPVAEAADRLLTTLASLAAEHPGQKVALIADGEVRCAVTGNGMGGRNSAFVLCCVEKIAQNGFPLRNVAVLSAGTDGKDGVSPAAGAVADETTASRARACGLDPADFYQRSDSYNFFRVLGDAIETGPTGNNLRDLRILLAE